MTYKEQKNMYNLYKEGKTLAEIAEMYQIHLTTVHLSIKQYLNHEKNMKNPLYKIIQELDIKSSAKIRLYNILRRNQIDTIEKVLMIDTADRKQMEKYNGIGNLYCKYILFLQNHIKK